MVPRPTGEGSEARNRAGLARWDKPRSGRRESPELYIQAAKNKRFDVDIPKLLEIDRRLRELRAGLQEEGSLGTMPLIRVARDALMETLQFLKEDPAFRLHQLTDVTAAVNDDAHAQKAGPAIRLGVAGISGSNSYPYVSKQLNLFAKYNVDVELVVFQGGTQMTQAMVSGDLPLGLIDGPPVMAANLAGANLVMIAGNINTFPYTIISKSEFRNALDLKGKRIGISRYGSSSDTAVRLTLERQNLKPDRDAAILQIGGQSERFAALRAGAIDATIVSPPFNLVARRLGFKDLIDISEMGIPYAHLQVAARVDFVDRYPDLANVNFVIRSQYCRGGDQGPIQARPIGRVEILHPPLAVMKAKARMAGGDSFVRDWDITNRITPKGNLRLNEVLNGWRFIV